MFESRARAGSGIPVSIGREVAGYIFACRAAACAEELKIVLWAAVTKQPYPSHHRCRLEELAPKMQACEAPGRTLATTINERLANYRQLRPVSNKTCDIQSVDFRASHSTNR
jgi:hypothetical protein